MRLEKACYYITDIHYGRKTALKDHTLFLYKEELRDHLKEDSRLGDVEIEIAHPGERVRIINVLDVIEPMIKSTGPGGVFPGILGRVEMVGQGRTLALKGVGVVSTGCIDIPWEGIIDMTGPGKLLSPYSSLQNVVLIPKMGEVADQNDYFEAITSAGLKTAEYLARPVLDLEPDEVELYELEPSAERESHLSKLPRIAYLYHIYSHSELRDTFYYGEKPRHLLPTIIHPNEIFDGAIVTGNYDMPSGMKNETVMIQNHPIIKELYRRHGKELTFAGVVIANEHAKVKEKEKSAVLAAKLVKHILGADAVVISQTGGGHPNIDLMLCCRMCEEQGVKTIIVVSEESSVDGSQFPLAMIVPEADAIVSTGNINEEVDLPSMDLVVGGTEFRKLGRSPNERLKVPYNMIPGATSQIGNNRLTTICY